MEVSYSLQGYLDALDLGRVMASVDIVGEKDKVLGHWSGTYPGGSLYGPFHFTLSIADGDCTGSDYISLEAPVCFTQSSECTPEKWQECFSARMKVVLEMATDSGDQEISAALSDPGETQLHISRVGEDLPQADEWVVGWGTDLFEDTDSDGFIRQFGFAFVDPGRLFFNFWRGDHQGSEPTDLEEVDEWIEITDLEFSPQ